MKVSNGSILFATLLSIPTSASDAYLCSRSDRPATGVAMFSPRSLMMEPFLTSPEQIIRRQQDFINRAFTHISPHYTITDSDSEIKISIDVPGVKAQDVQVLLENDGKVLTVTSHRETHEAGDSGEVSSSSSKFSQSFALDPTVDIDKFKANLEDGVLHITAPKDSGRLEKSMRKIPVETTHVDTKVGVMTDTLKPEEALKSQ
jgi:HSP20 family molecular chaperone IbpA